MIRRTRTLFLVAVSALAVGAVSVPAAQANVLSILPGSCGIQAESQPFLQWGDTNFYSLVPGGNFEHGSGGWVLSGHAAVTSGNETFKVGGMWDSHSLSLPAGSSATSPSSCTSIWHPSVRFFVRNTGSPTSRLRVQALYPGLLGSVESSTLGEITASSAWEPADPGVLLVDNLLATLSLSRTTIAFRFTPVDNTGAWSVDDVYLDPFARW